MLGEYGGQCPWPGSSPGMKATDLPMSEKNPPATGSSPRRMPWWPLGVAAVIFLFALFSNRGILHIIKLKQQRTALQQQLGEVEEVNGGLRKEIASLSSDRHHLERMARSQLGMVRDDEVVYQFASKQSPAPAAAPAAPPR
ncbi:MAG: septum formation initiator family protein [Deltaproteobacteria bacterium]|nr:MAG: septum formation initiator family protein [Deltaproteobacteria bacterium]